MPKSILVLDDDANFRELLVRILEPTGFEVIEASSASEALAADFHADFALAIVDFRLPDTDGMTFISRLRAAGLNTPVVFISANACDPKTFNLLRNILHVSLVLQKPIDPKLFLQQIDVLLPMERKSTSDMSRPAADQPANRMQEPDADPLRAKKKWETTVQLAQKDLATKMPAEWEKLAKALRTFQHDLRNPSAREEVLLLAHKLRGTAGSLGLMKVTDAAAKIEDYAKLLDPTDFLQEEILWLEIFRALADGESALSSVMQPAAETQAGEPSLPAAKVLLLAGPGTLQKGDHQLSSFDAKVSFTDSPVQAAMKASSTRFDAAVLDVSITGKQGAFSLARALRINGLNDQLPLAFIQGADTQIDAAEKLFYGCSVLLNAPCTQQQFETAVRKLAAVKPSRQVRVLTVDDDPILTDLIEKVLSGHGMNVSTLNQPINILETLEKTQPELVLLDVIMPGLSGYDVCRLIRSHEQWNELPIVFLTSKSDAAGRAAAFHAGANDFLAKPIIAEELVARVKMQMRNDRVAREQGATDEVTGLLTKDAFTAHVEDLFEDAVHGRRKLSICLIQIQDFDAVDTYGVLSKMNVLSTFGKLFQSRFTPEALRGRWGDAGFAIAFTDDEPAVVEKAGALLAAEFEQITFMGELGPTFNVRVNTASAHYPKDSDSLIVLIEAAEYRLASPKAFH